MIWRWWFREWRSPSLFIVWLTLVLSLSCIFVLSSVSGRMQELLGGQNRDFLAGDLVLRSSYPVDESWLQQAENVGLTLSQQLSFQTMAYAGDMPLLVSVKSVEKNYPLYGTLVTNPPNLHPKSGEVLVSTQVLLQLQRKIGDSLEIGDAEFTIIGELLQEPDAGLSFFDIAPKVLILLEDSTKTGAIQPGSRLTYRYMFAGSRENIENYSIVLNKRLTSDQRVRSTEENSGPVGQYLERSRQFLLLCTLLTVALSASALVIAMNHYCKSRHSLVAILKTLGADKRILRRFLLGQWLVLIGSSIVVGLLVGRLLEFSLLKLLADIFPKEVPSAGFRPIFTSLTLLLFVAVAVSLKPYQQLLMTQPLQILRQGSVVQVWPSWLYWPLVGVIGVVLLGLLLGFTPLLGTIILGIVGFVLLLGSLGLLGLSLIKRMTGGILASRLALNRLLRQPMNSISQLGTFSFSFMLLALLFSLQGGLLDNWKEQLPEKTPNYFLMNISPQQRVEVTQFLTDNHIYDSQLYPVVRVRLTHINGEDVLKTILPGSEGFATVERELNLTWLEELPESNKVIEGQWPAAQTEVSIEEVVAKQLHLSLGDKLTFVGNAESFSATVSSIRKVTWESLQPNFFFIFPPGTLDSQPQNWLTSFYHDGDPQLITQLNRQFPTVSVLDVGSILLQMKQMLTQISAAIQFMVALVMSCGVILLCAQLQVGMQQRRQELDIYRILGAKKRLLRNTVLIEFFLLGMVSGIIAVIGTEITLWLLQERIFSFAWQPAWKLWVVLPILAVVLLSLFGTILVYHLFAKKGLKRIVQEF